MNKIIFFLASFTAAGLAAALAIQHQSHAKYAENAAWLRSKDEQLAALTAKSERLSNLVANSSSDTMTDIQTSELAKLRSEVDALKRQSNDLIKLFEAKHAPKPASESESNSAEYWEALQRAAIIKLEDAKHLSWAFLNYVHDHHGQCPDSPNQLAPYLAKFKWAVSGTNQFEIVYRGSIVADTLETIPVQTIAVIRDKQTWQGEGGRMMRVYGFVGAEAQIISSDDDFQSWEAQHVIFPSKSGQ